MSTESYDVDAFVVELRARIRELVAELAAERQGREIDNQRFAACKKARIALGKTLGERAQQLSCAQARVANAEARAKKAEAARDSWRNQAKVQEARVAEREEGTYD